VNGGRVLVVGVDGVRFDALGPAVLGLGQDGFLTPIVIDEATPTWSGPCWANIATGVPVSDHNVLGNDLTGHRLDTHPDFLTIATRAGHTTLLAVSGWPPLALATDGGPLFALATRREFIEVSNEYEVAAWDAADEAVTSLAVAAIGTDAPRVSFVYLGAVDMAGHLHGVGSSYRDAAAAADERVGRLIGAVRSRPSYAREDWTIVVVTDHGHVDAGGHGGREPSVVTAWAAVAGPGISPGRPPLVTSHLDIAPLILRRLSRAV
jgi:Type I phosphodiesterase / nucleotide pyrophosphatase